MKRRIGVAALLALVSAVTLTGAALAQCGQGQLIFFDADCFAYEDNYNPATFNSAAGSNLNVVGIVSLFCAPLDDLVANDPGKEYTFLWTNLVSAGTVLNGNTWHTDYAGGDFFIYEGSPRNAPTAAGNTPSGPMPPSPPNGSVPVNFTDGTLILQGTLSGFNTDVTRFACGPNTCYDGSFRSDYQFTGPASSVYYQRFLGYGKGLLGNLWCPTGTAPGECGLPAGYSAHPHGKFDAPTPPTPASSSTWGAIKQLYR